MKIGFDEQLDNMKTWRYRLYLNVGNMDDILNMSLDDFKGVVEVMIHEETPVEKRFKKQSKSQKDMIKRLKDIKNKVVK